MLPPTLHLQLLAGWSPRSPRFINPTKKQTRNRKGSIETTLKVAIPAVSKHEVPLWEQAVHRIWFSLFGLFDSVVFLFGFGFGFLLIDGLMFVFWSWCPNPQDLDHAQ